MAAVARGFDSLARGYDTAYPRSRSLALMRATALAAWQRAARPGEQWLELGAGTGRDAVAVARRGIHVLAADISTGMLDRLRHRLRTGPTRGRIIPMRLGTGDLERLLPRWRGRLDGVAILFGALNYGPDPGRLPPLLAALLRPGGRVIAAVRNRVCPWELAYSLAFHPNPRLAFRRFHPAGAVTTLGRQTVRMRVYTPGELTRLFRPAFRRTALRGLAVALPPYMIAGFSRRFPRLERWLERLEPVIAPWPGFRSLGDHFLAEFVRR